MNSATFWAWVFGFASLASLVFAVYVYFKSHEYIYPLIEKLRASRNNLVHINTNLKRINDIAALENATADEKVRMMRQVARTISEGIHTCMNTIDDGFDWNKRNVKQIYDGIRSSR
ncbi:MAG: hypothetical protein ACT4OT_11820 [Acidobacteriota bacterium]